MSRKSTLNKEALKVAASKLRKLRLETVYGRKERPAETVKSAVDEGLVRLAVRHALQRAGVAEASDETIERYLEGGYSGLGTQEGVEFILDAGIRFYLKAVEEMGLMGGESGPIVSLSDPRESVRPAC